MTKLSRDNSGLNFVTSSKKVNVGEGHCLLTTNRKSTNLLQKTVNVVSKMGRVKKSATDRVPAGTKNMNITIGGSDSIVVGDIVRLMSYLGVATF